MNYAAEVKQESKQREKYVKLINVVYKQKYKDSKVYCLILTCKFGIFDSKV